MDDLNPCISDPKDTTNNLLKLINAFSTVVVYDINTQRSVAYLYMNNKRTEREAIVAVLNNRIHKTVECILGLCGKGGLGKGTAGVKILK